MILLTQEADHLQSPPEEAMEKYPFPHVVEFQPSAPHMRQEGQDENTAKKSASLSPSAPPLLVFALSNINK